MAQDKNFERFGRFLLLHRIAIGGMAEIFLAHPIDSPDPSQILVIKRIRDDLTHDESFIEMFIDEARLVSRLSHPNIIRLLEFGLVDGRYFIALEHVWGESLRTLTLLCTKAKMRFPLGAALFIGAETAAALDNAHNQRDANGELSPVIHRDVTMGNVVVSYHGDVKVLDYGIAKAKGRLSQTRAGQIKGTLSYLAPEQLRGQEMGPHTDIYQLGVLLYQTLVGRLPVNGESEGAMMAAIVAGQIVKPSEVVAGFPAGIERILLKAMARDPARRFASAAELEGALREVIKGTPYAEGTQRLAHMITNITGDRKVKQSRFLKDLLKGVAVDRAAAEAMRWATVDDAPNTLNVELSSIIEQENIDDFEEAATIVMPPSELDALDLDVPPTIAMPLADAEFSDTALGTTRQAQPEPTAPAPPAAVPAPRPPATPLSPRVPAIAPVAPRAPTPPPPAPIPPRAQATTAPATPAAPRAMTALPAGLEAATRPAIDAPADATQTERLDMDVVPTAIATSREDAPASPSPTRSLRSVTAPPSPPARVATIPLTPLIPIAPAASPAAADPASRAPAFAPGAEDPESRPARELYAAPAESDRPVVAATAPVQGDMRAEDFDAILGGYVAPGPQASDELEVDVDEDPGYDAVLGGAGPAARGAPGPAPVAPTSPRTPAPPAPAEIAVPDPALFGKLSGIQVTPLSPPGDVNSSIYNLPTGDVLTTGRDPELSAISRALGGGGQTDGGAAVLALVLGVLIGLAVLGVLVYPELPGQLLDQLRGRPPGPVAPVMPAPGPTLPEPEPTSPPSETLPAAPVLRARLAVTTTPSLPIAYAGQTVSGDGRFELLKPRGTIGIRDPMSGVQFKIEFELNGNSATLQVDASVDATVNADGARLGPTPQRVGPGSQFSLQIKPEGQEPIGVTLSLES